MTPSPEHDLDLALLERIARRDASAVGELYDRHARVLFSFIRRIVRHHGDAEDVLQDVLLRVWDNADRYDPGLGPPIGWLVRIARNRAIDQRRARDVRPGQQGGSDLLPAVAASPAHAPCPEQSAANEEEHRAVLLAFRRLPTEQRELIDAAFFGGYTHTELASRFGVPLGTVKTRIRTGVFALRRHLRYLARHPGPAAETPAITGRPAR